MLHDVNYSTETGNPRVAVEIAVVAVRIVSVQLTIMINYQTSIAWKYCRMHQNLPFSRPSEPSLWSRSRSHKAYSTSWKIAKN